jgi:hypothetical protein
VALAWLASTDAPDSSNVEAPAANESAAVTESAAVAIDTTATKTSAPAPAEDESDIVIDQSPEPNKLEVGLTTEEVSRIEDAPVTHDDERWDYGPSWIMFERGKVVDWYSSPLRPLRHATMHPPPLTHEHAR